MKDSDLASGNSMSRAVFELAEKQGSHAVRVSAQVLCVLLYFVMHNILLKVESELCSLNPDERIDFLSALSVNDEECGLKVLVNAAYKSLGLQTFYTAGPTETRSWTIKAGATAPQVTSSC